MAQWHNGQFKSVTVDEDRDTAWSVRNFLQNKTVLAALLH